MPNRYTKILKLLGIDSAIGSQIIGRVWSVAAGPLTLLLLSRKLSSVELGYYYTFFNLAAAVALLELGLGYVVCQTVSHEMAYLKIGHGGELEGADIAKARVASIFKKATRWYAVVGAGAGLALGVAGYGFFPAAEQVASAPNWGVPWILMVVSAVLSCLMVPFFSVLEGIGLINQIAKIRLAQQVLGNLVLWSALWFDVRLYAVPLFTCSTALVGIWWMVKMHRRFFRSMYSHNFRDCSGVDWKTEIFPMQWRIALTWVSGYLSYQLLNLMMFRYQGPEEAGRTGFSAAIASALLGVSYSWLSTKAARFGKYVSLGKIDELENEFWRAFKQSISILVVAVILVIQAHYVLSKIDPSIANKLLPVAPFSALLLAALVNHISFSQAVYLRAFKQEPFVWASCLSGILIALGVFVASKYGGPASVVYAYVACVAVSGAICTKIFIHKRAIWGGRLRTLKN